MADRIQGGELNVAAHPMRVLSLCSGVGMHDVGLGAAFHARTICYVEREAFAAAQLVNLMETQCLDEAPVWSDLATFDARPWRGVVDCIVAGLPCQPYSSAGKQLGNEDHRSHGDGDGPIVHFLRVVAECRPAVVFLENVPGWVTNKRQWFRPVGEELCRLGYEIEEPLILAAEDVGASHKRQRVWIMAVCPRRGLGVLRESLRGYGLADGCGIGLADSECNGVGRDSGAAFSAQSEDEGWRSQERDRVERLRGNVGISGHSQSSRAGVVTQPEIQFDADRATGVAVDNPASPRRGGRESGASEAVRDEARRGEPRGRCDGMADTGCDKSGSGRGDAGEVCCISEAQREPEHGSAISGGDGGELADTGRECREVSPFGGQPAVEVAGTSEPGIFAPGPSDSRWPRILAAAPHLAPATEPGVHGMADGLALVVDESRRNQLRALGNGGVPLCSAVAFGTLARRALR